MRAFPFCLGWLVCLLVVGIAHAQSNVPTPLEPWRAWVLKGQQFRACPLIAGRAGNAPEDFVCAWPGMLALDADATGASFGQHWKVDAESWIALPGDAEHWPQQVTVDGQPAAVVDHAGPALRLAAGNHEVRARIGWRERPQTLRVPQAIGLVTLHVDGKPVAPVQRDGDELTLGRVAAAVQAESLDLRVYRRLGDGVPAELSTVIEVHASGQAREEIIGPVLPVGFMPLALSGEWPARLDADGRLRVRVQPGNDTLTLTARATAPLAAITAHLPAAPWPRQEIWSYASAPRVSVSVATSAVQVDPNQAQVPSGWRELPAFALVEGSELKIDERSRGLAADEHNRLSLEREMWLDFDGSGWFARDRVHGEMVQGWRFDAAAPFALERAAAMGEGRGDHNDEALLVTRGADQKSSGVEWRTPAVDLGASLRIAAAGAALPVTGWQDSFDQVATTLHLPDGYQLLGAPGADSAPGSWISAWTLLDVFIAAVLVLLAWRLFGVAGALVATAYLVLGYQERGVPLWTLLAVIVLALIARALPDGRLAWAAIWLQRAALLLLVLLALPFATAQLRYALHPQLQSAGGYALGDLVAGFSAEGNASRARTPAPSSAGTVEESSPMAMSAPPPANAPQAAPAANDKLQTFITVSGSNIRRLDIMDHYSESTVVQTGAGEPHWNLGRRYELSWSGPVLPTQSVRLVIAPPWLVRPLRVVLVALLAWLLLRLLRPSLRKTIPGGAHMVLAGALALGALAASALTPAHAQAFPPDNLLKELRTQLTEAPKCAPDCAAIAKAAVSARGDEIRVALEAHAADRVALPLPVDEKNLVLRSVRVDGVVQDGLAHVAGKVWLALPRGVHRIELTFGAAADKSALAFPLKPMRIEFVGEGWQASGIADDHLLTETLTLVRAREGGVARNANDAQQFAPFVRVERSVTLGLDWVVTTQVVRLAPAEGGFTVALPVLAGEHVTTPGLKVENGQLTAAIADGAAQAEWASNLDKGESLALTAPPLTDHAEVWRVVVSPIWHAEFSGVPGIAIDTQEDAHDYRRFAFHPLPGETLAIKVTRPAALQGTTRAIDAVHLGHAVGQRAANSTLTLTIRASQGGEHAIVLPAEAEVFGVTRNGEALNLRPQGDKLSLPLVPGTQTFELRLRDNTPAGFVARTPAIALGLPAANIDLGIDLPADRWLLATGGPAAGPAVLYWSELVVMLLLACALARTRRSSLTLRQWILLGLGFSTFSWFALLVVVAWLFALDWRMRRTSLQSARVFNLVQIALALLTVLALLCVAAAIPQGLLGSPDMHVAGNGSGLQSLRWFADRSTGALPVAYAISLPLWVYKLAMLAWALWLANALVGWLRAGFLAWTQGGYWRSTLRPVIDVPTMDAPAPPALP